MGRDRFVSTVRPWGAVLAVLCSSTGGAHADDADLAKQLTNPVASLISVPFRFNYDRGFRGVMTFLFPGQADPIAARQIT